MGLIIQRIPWTQQPQYPVVPGFRLDTLLSPAGGGVFRNAYGNVWTYNNSANLSSGTAVFGRAVINASTGYVSRTDTYGGGPLTLGFVFTPSTITGTVGLWSLASTNASAGPYMLLQRNGADLRFLANGAYQATLTGVFSVGKQANIIVALAEIGSSTPTTPRTIAINGLRVDFSGANGPRVTANEYFMSGYNGQLAGAYGEFWASRSFMPELAVPLSLVPWGIYRPQIRRIWVPDAAPAGGFKPYWSRNQTRIIGAGVR